jgi:predicted secreted hydrolase
MVHFVVGFLTVLMIGSCTVKPDSVNRDSTIDPVSFLSERTEVASGYTEATEGYSFDFPFDHGSHETFKNEWWYFTGNLYDEAERHYGFQFTIFRSALTPNSPQGLSDWDVKNIYMAHLTLTDTTNETFYQHEKFSRDSLGLAGSSTVDLNVWVDDWSIRGGGNLDEPITLYAQSNEIALKLNLTATKPVILQGNEGLSVKSADNTAKSHYYSIPRLLTEGAITINGTNHLVAGAAWMDREWSSSSLGPYHSGWDWFALQLSNGSDLMYYSMRFTNGREDAASAGTLVSKSGEVIKLKSSDVTLEVMDHWQSPIDGTSYPASWIIKVPSLGLDLVVEPVLADQELHGVFRYWEGAVRCSGQQGTVSVGCAGYVELTGY